MSIAFPITGVILTNILGFNIMVSYYSNRSTQIKKYNEYLFYIIFFNCLSWMVYGVLTRDHLIYLSCVSSLFFDFGFIHILYKHADQNIIFKLEMLSGVFILYFVSIIYLISFTQINKTNTLLPIVGTVSMLSSIATNFSPFLIVGQVIKTKSNELIYLPQALIGCINLSCWLAYGLILHDIYQIITNALGLSMCVIQVLVYWIYSGPANTSRVGPNITEEPIEQDNQMINDEEFKQEEYI